MIRNNALMAVWRLMPCIAAGLLATPVQAADTADRRPNVVLVLTDDQGYGDVGFNGNPWLKTPVLDKLAAEAAIFDQFYANAVCAPTRAALMTGRHTCRTGVTNSGSMRPSETTVAEALKSAGYATGLFGKWHLGDQAPCRPVDQGFDRYLTIVGGMIGAEGNPLDGNSYFNPMLIEDGRQRRFEGYCTDIFFDEAIKFIRAARDRPFFVYLAPNTPHHPLTVADRYAKPYLDAGLSDETSLFYGMIANIDANMARLRDALEESGKWDDTILVFLGDNGTSSLHKQADLWECGMRGRKAAVYENGIRVPMFIRLPGTPANGKRLATQAQVEDLMPTILAACRVPVPDGVALDGMSLLPVLGNPDREWPERAILRQLHGGTPQVFRHCSVRRGNYKLVQPEGLQGGGEFSTAAARFELYDIAKDPFEKHDIAAEHPQIVEALKAEHRAWIEDVAAGGFDPVPTWVGMEGQGVVVLSSIDRNGARNSSTEPPGYLLDVKKAGRYRITCRWPEPMKETHPCTLRIGDRVLTKDILYAETECRFDEVELGEGLCTLTPWIEKDGKNQAFLFVEIERLNK